MASVCDVCGKGPGFGMSVSHSHRRTHRRWNPNVQTVRALVAPGTRRRHDGLYFLSQGWKSDSRLTPRRPLARLTPVETGRNYFCSVLP